MRGTAGGCFSDGGGVSGIAGVEFNHVPTHVFSDGSRNRCFPNARWADEQNGFLLGRPVLPFIKPGSNFSPLNLVALQQLFRAGTMPLRPIARLTHAKHSLEGSSTFTTLMFEVNPFVAVRALNQIGRWPHGAALLCLGLTVTVPSSID